MEKTVLPPKGPRKMKNAKRKICLFTGRESQLI
jgi:hypothetical protein